MDTVSSRNSNAGMAETKKKILPSDLNAASKPKMEIKLHIRTLHGNALFSVHEREPRSAMCALWEERCPLGPSGGTKFCKMGSSTLIFFIQKVTYHLLQEGVPTRYMFLDVNVVIQGEGDRMEEA